MGRTSFQQLRREGGDGYEEVVVAGGRGRGERRGGRGERRGGRGDQLGIARVQGGGSRVQWCWAGVRKERSSWAPAEKRDELKRSNHLHVRLILRAFLVELLRHDRGGEYGPGVVEAEG